MQFDWTLNIGNIFAILVPLFIFGWKVWRFLARVEYLVREFPPHRHINGKVIYPRDMGPET